MSDFDGKVVIVTGSSSGIGEGTAIHFASLGANVIVTGRNADRVRNVAEQCRKVLPNKSQILDIVADLTNKDDIKKIIDETIKTFGRIDVLVNNAGTAFLTEIEDSDINEKYDIIMDTNVRSLVLLCHYAVPHLTKTKGNIVNVSSVASEKPHSKFFVYCMAKTAVDMLTKCLTIDLGNRGIRVNAVNPAVIKTGLFANSFHYDDKEIDKVYEDCRKNYPLQRPGEPKEVAEAIAFLASPKASFISGATVEVDGGSMWTSRGPVD